MVTDAVADQALKKDCHWERTRKKYLVLGVRLVTVVAAGKACPMEVVLKSWVRERWNW